jgi:hypothetical protein
VIFIEPEVQGQAQAQSMGVAPISDSELRSFAVAALEVQRINNEYMPRVEAARTSEEQQQLVLVATNEKVQAVETRGLSVEKYQEILQQAQTDPEMADRIVEHIESEQK